MKHPEPMRLLQLLLLALLFTIYGCNQNEKHKPLIQVNEVSPWCILGFDSLERSPAERISMLKELGLHKYGYNRGKGQFNNMVSEFNLARENEIEITSVFLWLNAERDSIGKLSESNQLLLSNLKEVHQKPKIWISFNDNFFENLNEQQTIQRAVEMIYFIKTSADQLGCKMALYNHHGWFGNPYNQIKVLKALKDDSITMVYNFHHAHDFVDEFSEIAKIITPHLSFVNLNGVNKEGPQILPIGKGDYERDMIKCLIREGYDGPWGILGHIKTDDVKKVLKRNIKGLQSINSGN